MSILRYMRSIVGDDTSEPTKLDNVLRPINLGSTNDTLLHVSHILDEIIIRNQYALLKNYNATPLLSLDCAFTSHRPQMCLYDYIIRYCKYMMPTHYEIIYAIIIIDRLTQSFLELFQEHILTVANAHKIIITAFILSQKINNDTFHTLSYISQVIGYDKQMCIRCEISFMKIVNGKLFVDDDEYSLYKNLLDKIIKDDLLD